MSDEPYRVGYRCPPRRTQFKPGQSGNPKGREKGRKNIYTEALEILGERIKVNEGDRQRFLAIQTVILKGMAADAAQGNAKARDQVLRLIAQIDAVDTGSRPLSAATAEDAEIMARFKARLIEEIKAQDGTT